MTTPTGANLPAFTTSFGYDATNQLTSVTSPLQGESYSFDLAGNRKTATTGGSSQSYTTKDNRITNDGKYSYVYDKEGNLLSKRHLATGQTTFYTWDHRNRLTRVETRATSSPTSTLLMQAVYVYDVFDRRISKDVDSDGAGTTAVTTRESYVYDGPHITIEFRDPDASGPQLSALSVRRLYGAAVDQILAEEQYPAGGGPSSVYWSLTDWLGSVRDLVNSSGAVVKHIDYESFGNAIRVTDGSGNPSTLNAQPSTRILWTGREFDSETKLQYNRARYYDAAIGRWLSEDPIGFAAGDANLYRYVGNEAPAFSDPSGRFGDPVRMDGRPAGQLKPPKRNADEGSITDPRRGPDVGPDGGFFSMDTIWWFGGWEKRKRRDGTWYWHRFSRPVERWEADANAIPFNPVPVQAIGAIAKGKIVEGLARAAVDIAIGKVFSWGGKLWQKLPDGTFRYLGDAAEEGSQKVAKEVSEEAAERALKRAKILENRAKGRKFEEETVEKLKETQEGVVEQLTVKTNKSGTRTRLDAAGRDQASGSTKLNECKSSDTAPLTPNQRQAFPEIEESGGVVVGRGKPGFPGGTEIPPTKVDVIRP